VGLKLYKFSQFTIPVCALIFLVILSGCSFKNFSLMNLAKSEIDVVADYHYMEVESLLKELTAKLYKRNPKYLNSKLKSNGQTFAIKDRLENIFGSPGKINMHGISEHGIAAIELSLDGEFQGDRVFAFMAGLTEMVRKSYGYRHDFFIHNALKEQDLYLSARNLEIALWRITSFKSESGDPLILTNSRDGETENLSYERLFGKMISLQDMLAKIMSGKNNRIIKTVVKKVATTAFVPF